MTSKWEETGSTPDADEEVRQLKHTEQVIRYFATAYVLDIAGMLDSPQRNKLDGLSRELGSRWQSDVEQRHGLSPVFIRNLYATLLDKYLPHEAAAFVLRGLGFVYPEPLIEELLQSDSESLDDSDTTV